MKLELKHLVAYLPYGLKFKISEGKIFNLNANHIFNNHTGNYKGLDENAKIILRPLSDLTKEIEVNGERFVPDEQMCGQLKQVDYSVGNAEVTKREAYFFFYNPKGDKIGFAYEDYQKLFQWHFDVFNLIESGLAIDINTLNK